MNSQNTNGQLNRGHQIRVYSLRFNCTECHPHLSRAGEWKSIIQFLLHAEYKQFIATEGQTYTQNLVITRFNNYTTCDMQVTSKQMCSALRTCFSALCDNRVVIYSFSPKE